MAAQLDVALLVVEFGGQPAMHLDAIDALEEIEKPMAAVKLAVGADRKPDFALHSHGLGDTLVFDLARSADDSAPDCCFSRAAWMAVGRSRLPTTSALNGGLWVIVDVKLSSLLSRLCITANSRVDVRRYASVMQIWQMHAGRACSRLRPRVVQEPHG